mmetsp:Transcript_43188/g.111993  ORF Transcript_43188/g.111993 Transcript_43188/m.111993 type:complete len:494 (+) Transcript_43188:794-2275(+)
MPSSSLTSMINASFMPRYSRCCVGTNECPFIRPAPRLLSPYVSPTSTPLLTPCLAEVGRGRRLFFASPSPLSIAELPPSEGGAGRRWRGADTGRSFLFTLPSPPSTCVGSPTSTRSAKCAAASISFITSPSNIFSSIYTSLPPFPTLSLPVFCLSLVLPTPRFFFLSSLPSFLAFTSLSSSSFFLFASISSFSLCFFASSLFLFSSFSLFCLAAASPSYTVIPSPSRITSLWVGSSLRPRRMSCLFFTSIAPWGSDGKWTTCITVSLLVVSLIFLSAAKPSLRHCLSFAPFHTSLMLSRTRSDGKLCTSIRKRCTIPPPLSTLPFLFSPPVMPCPPLLRSSSTSFSTVSSPLPSSPFFLLRFFVFFPSAPFTPAHTFASHRGVYKTFSESSSRREGSDKASSKLTCENLRFFVIGEGGRWSAGRGRLWPLYTEMTTRWPSLISSISCFSSFVASPSFPRSASSFLASTLSLILRVDEREKSRRRSFDCDMRTR